MSRHIPPPDRKPVSNNFKELDKTIRRYLNNNTNVMFYPWELNEAGNVHLWHPRSPLINYADTLFKINNDSLATLQKKWIAMAPQYGAYGIYLIGKYPLQYLKYYAAYGIKHYYAPPLEYLERYYSGRTEIPDIAKNWFRYKNNKVITRLSNGKTSILIFYSYLNGITNTIIFFGLLYYWLLKGGQYSKEFKKAIQLATVAWFTNALFTISLTVSALRLQAFPIIFTTTFALLLVDWMVQLMKKGTLQTNDQKSEASSRLTAEIA